MRETPKYFISYRRDDSAGSAGRLFDKLVRKFGHANVFKDVDSIPLGSNFREVITEKIRESDIVFAVIGRAYLSVPGEKQQARIFDPDDFVNIEIATAFEEGKIVIPVLVDKAQMPQSSQLPKNIDRLAFQNGISLRHENWDRDVQKLIDELEQVKIPSRIASSNTDTQKGVPHVLSAAGSSALSKIAAILKWLTYVVLLFFCFLVIQDMMRGLGGVERALYIMK